MRLLRLPRSAAPLVVLIAVLALPLAGAAAPRVDRLAAADAAAIAARCERVLCAGAGKAEMTPPVGTPMAGFNSRSGAGAGAPDKLTSDPDPNLYAKTFVPSLGVHTRLHARAVVLQDADGDRIAVVSAENRGIPYEAHQAVIERLTAADAGINRDNLLIASTHSHAAAGPVNPWPGYQAISTDVFDPRIFAITVEAITTAVLEAVTELAPARAGVGDATVDDATRNRSMTAHLANYPPGTEIDEREAVDQRVPVLRVERLDGQPVAALSTFAVHGTSFGGSWPYLSGDNMAWSMRAVEETLGAVAVQLNGAEGDVSPSPANPPAEADTDAERAALVGQRVAGGVLRAWEDANPTPVLDLDAIFSILWFRGQDGTSPTPLVGCPGNVCPDGTRLPADAPGGHAGKVPLGGAPGAYPPYAPLQVLRFGSTALVGVPFEPTTMSAARIEQAVLEAAGGAIDRAVIVGMANSYTSYLATPEEYDAAYYEGSWTLYGRLQQPLVERSLADLAARLAGGQEPAPFDEPPVLGSLLSAEPTAPVPDTSGQAGTLISAPTSLTAGGEVTLAWYGGDPAVDHARDEVLVALVDASGQTVVTDDSPELIVSHQREATTSPHRWTLAGTLPVDLAAGEYRFVITGHARDAEGTHPYQIETPVFPVVS